MEKLTIAGKLCVLAAFLVEEELSLLFLSIDAALTCMIRELCYFVRPFVLLAAPLALLLGEELELAPSRLLEGDWPFCALEFGAILKEPPPLCIRFNPLIEFYLLAMRTLFFFL